MSEIINYLPCLTNKNSYSLKINRLTLICADMLSFVLAFIITAMYSTSSDHMPIIGTALDESTYRSFTFFSISVFTILVFWGKYRHYIYRKPFWDELNEMFSLLAIMALIDVALFSFAK